MKNRKKLFEMLANVCFLLVIAIYFFEPSSRSVSSYFMLASMGMIFVTKLYERQGKTLKSVDELEKQILLEIFSLSYNSILIIVIIIGILGFIFYHDSPVFMSLVLVYFLGVFVERVVEVLIRKKYQ